MNSYPELLAYLDELQENSIKLGLERVARACARLGKPELKFRSVHIAGTNGKGSTAAYVESIVRRNGYRTGLYISPHLIDVRERMQIGREWISEKEILKYANIVREKCHDIGLSYFEVLTLIAFLYFAGAKIDLGVIETGLGGRLDATNVIWPLVSVLTPISIDHTGILGSDILSIAKEKCGIIKTGVPVVSAVQDATVKSLIKITCAEMGCSLTVSEPRTDIEPGLPGRHQLTNASLALKVVEELSKNGYKIKNAETSLDVTFSGRLQKISDDPEIILDGAHNLSGTLALSDHLEEKYKNRNIIVIFGAMRDKDLGGMVDNLKRVARRWVVVPLKGDRAATAEELMTVVGGVPCVSIDAKSAVNKALSYGLDNPLIVVTGSLYLVGEFLKENAKNFSFHRSCCN